MTHYNMCFKTLDPNYEPLKFNKNPIDTTKETFENTKKFVELLNRHSNDFFHLEGIASRISALNDYFCSQLAVKTNYTIKLDAAKTVEDFKISANYSHQLAKLVLADIPGFIASINTTVQELEKENRSQIHVNPEKMDAVDSQLLISSHIEAPLLSRRFGDDQPYSASAQRGGHRDRSVSALLQEEGFAVTTQADPELSQITKSLKKFAYTVEYNGYKLGL